MKTKTNYKAAKARGASPWDQQTTVRLSSSSGGQFESFSDNCDQEFAWLDARWLPGTANSFCPACGKRIGWPPVSLGLDFCRCGSL